MDRLVRIAARSRELVDPGDTVVTAVTCATHRWGSGARRRTRTYRRSRAVAVEPDLPGPPRCLGCLFRAVLGPPPRPRRHRALGRAVQRGHARARAPRPAAPHRPLRAGPPLVCRAPRPRRPAAGARQARRGRRARADRRHRAHRRRPDAVAPVALGPPAGPARARRAGARRPGAAPRPARRSPAGSGRAAGCAGCSSSPRWPSCSSSSRSSCSRMLPLWALAPAVLRRRLRPSSSCAPGCAPSVATRCGRSRRRQADLARVARPRPPVGDRARRRSGRAAAASAGTAAAAAPRLVEAVDGGRRRPSRSSRPSPVADAVADPAWPTEVADGGRGRRPTSWCRSSTRTTSRSPGTPCRCPRPTYTMKAKAPAGRGRARRGHARPRAGRARERRRSYDERRVAGA